MAKFSKKKNAGINVNLKVVVKKLQKNLLSGMRPSSCNDQDSEGMCNYVPGDVKEGHFAVVAVDGDEFKRLVVPLSCLTHPTFLGLLERAAEEYGFDHGGALTIPCRPSDLEMILADQDWQQH